MRRVRGVREAVLASSLLCCIGIGSPAWPADPAGSIRVVITHQDGSPMVDVDVMLHSGRNGPMIRQARTCDDGQVLLEDLEPADYEVRAAKLHYSTIVIPGIVVHPGRRISLPLTLRRADVLIYCPVVGTQPEVREPGSVRAEVRDPDGDPMTDAQVTLHARRDGPAVREARSGDDGLVLFADVAPGAYVIKAAKPGYGTLLDPDVRVLIGRQFPVQLTLRRTDSPRPCDPLVGLPP